MSVLLAGTSRPVVDIMAAAQQPSTEVTRLLGVDGEGLRTEQVIGRQLEFGPNAVASHRARPWTVLWHQVRSPLLGLLLVAAIASWFVGEQKDAVIIAIILSVSVGLGFVNEFRAEKAAEALHSQIHHRTVVRRSGRTQSIDVTTLVPGDRVEVQLGDIVPADLRLITAVGLECDESMLTGESLPVDKNIAAVPPETPLAELSGCALMGTVVHAGRGEGVVVSTGPRTEFGKIAAGLDTHQLDTQFQVGLRRFSMLLVYVAGALTISIFVINVVLDRPILDALLFSLAIAVGITPQLLPAVVSTSLAAGSRRMSRRRVLVKRLVCIEDLGDVDLLFTDKTGTLTEGEITFIRAIPAGDQRAETVVQLGLLSTENAPSDGRGIGGNPLDQALWAAHRDAPGLDLTGYNRLGALPFDHDRRMVSVLLRDPAGHTVLVGKGAPETVLERCLSVPDGARMDLQTEFAAGNRVVAVAQRPTTGSGTPTADDESGLTLVGFLVFLDPPKADAAVALARLAALGIRVKVVTGDNAAVAVKVCRDLGLDGGGALTGVELDAMDDDGLAEAIDATTVFARVSPEHKARIVRVQRLSGAGWRSSATA